MCRLSFALPLVLVAVPPAPASAQVIYTVTDLGPGFAQAVNNAGQVAGFNTTDTFRAFRWSAATGTVDVGGISGLQPGRVAINSSGQVAGTVAAMRAFRTTPTGGIDTGADLGTVSGQSSAFGINDLGQVTGFDRPETGGVGSPPERAFRTTATGGVTTASILAMPANITQSSGWGINASGQVAGMFDTVSGQTRAFRTSPTGDLTDPNAYLGTLGGASSGALAINAIGQVTGWSVTADGSLHAFRTTATGNLSDPAADLGVLPGHVRSQGWGINSFGMVVGDSQAATGFSHAFVYDTQMRDLNDLIPAGSGLLLESARGINDLGWIVGEARLNGEFRAFLLTPVPEPSALLLAGVAVAGGWAARRVRKR